MSLTLRIGTRGSKLALWQTEKVREGLMEAFPELQIEVKIYKTLGDRNPELDLLRNQGKGVFCTEIEEALIKREIDLAVHSVKDLPGELPEGLVLGAYLRREDPREVLVGRDRLRLEELPAGARVGTSSIRRLLQLKQLRPDLDFQPIRGNVETRVRKVLEGRYDATILALAGLRRLKMENCITQIFEVDEIIPAPGQGCIGVEIREDDKQLMAKLQIITHHETTGTVRAERAFLRRMGGNCESASGAFAQRIAEKTKMMGLYGKPEGPLLVRTIAGPADEAEALGVRLAEELLGTE